MRRKDPMKECPLTSRISQKANESLIKAAEPLKISSHQLSGIIIEYLFGAGERPNIANNKLK